MKNLVIKGAYYFTGDMIVCPLMTGQFYIVDCHTFETKSDLLDKYDQKYFKEVKAEAIEKDGVKYYPTEWGPVTVSEDWELLSDLSDLSHEENDFDF